MERANWWRFGSLFPLMNRLCEMNILIEWMEKEMSVPRKQSNQTRLRGAFLSVHLYHHNPLRWSTCQSQRRWSGVQALSSYADLAVELGSMKEVASCCNSDHRVHFKRCCFILRLFNEKFFLFITSDCLK